MPLAIHRSVIQGINNGKLDANLGPSATRTAVSTDGTTVYTCCHSNLYEIPVPKLTSSPLKSTSSDPDTSLAAANSAKPINLPHSHAVPSLHHIHHDIPVQSVACRENVRGGDLLASVDALGHLKWSCTNVGATTCGTITREKGADIESGWSGLAFGPSNQIAVVQHFDRTLSIADWSQGASEYVTTCRLSGCPTDVGFCGWGEDDNSGSSSSSGSASASVSGRAGHMLATTEGNAVVLYDVRQPSSSSEAGRCAVSSFARQAPSLSMLRALSTPKSWPDNILAASDDRFVYTVEPRNWRVLRRWRTPLKYEPVSLLRSPSKPALCYIAGLDNDVMCGDVGFGQNGTKKNGEKIEGEGSKKRKRDFTQLQMMFSTGFRGDGPWSGIAVRRDTDKKEADDVLYAVSQSCGLYVIKGATHLLDVRQ